MEAMQKQATDQNLEPNANQLNLTDKAWAGQWIYPATNPMISDQEFGRPLAAMC